MNETPVRRIYAARTVALIRAALSRPRLGAKESSFFFKRLSFLLLSGMPLAGALEMLCAQADTKAAKQIYQRLASEVAAGRALADALASSGAWGTFAPAVVEAGEASGRLPESLGYLADEITKSRALRSKVLGALIYPLVIAGVASVLVVVLTAFIFPKILPLLSGLGVTLPWPTRVLVGVSTFARKWGLVSIFCTAFAASVLAVSIRRSPRLQLGVDTGLLRLPVAGRMLREWNLASTARTLGTLLASGLPISRAVSASARACGNLAYRGALVALGEAIDRGERVSIALSLYPRLFPPLSTQMIAVGEASATLPETLASLAAFYESETDERARTLSSLVEPAVMILMGIAIGFVAVSIIAPIYAITGHLHAA